MKFNLLFTFLVVSTTIFAQSEACGITTPPENPVRSIAEWEELSHIVVTWDGRERLLLSKIIKNARKECEVVVAANNVLQCKNQLSVVYGFEDFDNITFMEAPSNTIWVRDYGANSVYFNDVEARAGVDWIYNRDSEPENDVLFCEIYDQLDIPLYQNLIPPFDLVHTGGNYMADGLGLAFSSSLVREENGSENAFGNSNHSDEAIKGLMQQYMGISKYIILEKLLYDSIGHIDMHMKLLDEETLLVGAYPENVSDGPQIEANLAYIQENYKTSFGTDFKIVRMDMPADFGDYPGIEFGDGRYFTYTNALFVNKTILVPIYNIDEDDVAIQQWQDLMPGYNIVPLNARNIISSLGAIHCITKEIGSDDPLWITHPQLKDVEIEQISGYDAIAQIKHQSGIASAHLFYKTDLEGTYTQISMEQMTNSDDWTATIPEQANQSTVYYYIQATANSGKTIARPMPAPEGYFSFVVDYPVNTIHIEDKTLTIGDVFPNPARSLTYIPFENETNFDGTVQILDVHGRLLETVHDGIIHAGDSKIFFDVSDYVAGIYFVNVVTGGKQVTKRFVVR